MNLGIPWREVQDSELTEVWARFTETDLVPGVEAAKVEGAPVLLMGTMLLLRKGSGGWCVHEVLDPDARGVDGDAI